MKLSPLPKYITPGDLDHNLYFDMIYEWNIKMQKNIQKDLHEILRGIKKRYSVITPGSDGRLEKGPGSKIELILLNNCEKNIQDCKPC